MKIIKKIGQQKYFANDTFHMWWSITNNCSLKCKYCMLQHSEKILEYKDIQKIIFFINQFSKKYKQFELNLFGGEPTNHPNFIQILNELEPKNIILNTNLEISKQYLVQIFRRDKFFDCCFSWHYNIGNNERFLSNIKILLKNYSNVTFVVLLMMEQKYKEELFILAEKLYDLYFQYEKDRHIVISPVFESSIRWDIQDIEKIQLFNQKKHLKNDNSTYYVEYMDGTIEHNVPTYYVRQNNNFQTYRCDVINKNLFIDSNGNVYPCQTYRNHNMMLLGNIIENTYVHKYIKHYCKLNHCDCEYMIPKYYNKAIELLRGLI